MPEVRFDYQFLEPAVSGWHFEGGEPVAGIVTMRGDRPRRCRFMWMRLSYRTHGSGYSDSEKVVDFELKSMGDPAQKSAEHQFEFQFIMPSEPWSYNGKLFQIEWTLLTIADFGKWAHKERQTITIRPKRQLESPHTWHA